MDGALGQGVGVQTGSRRQSRPSRPTPAVTGTGQRCSGWPGIGCPRRRCAPARSTRSRRAQIGPSPGLSSPATCPRLPAARWPEHSPGRRCRVDGRDRSLRRRVAGSAILSLLCRAGLRLSRCLDLELGVRRPARTGKPPVRLMPPRRAPFAHGPIASMLSADNSCPLSHLAATFSRGS